MDNIRLSEVLRAVSRACDVASARPYGFAQRVARVSMRLSAQAPLGDELRGDLLVASLCHSAGMAAVSGDVARVVFGDERPSLRLYPVDAVTSRLALGSPLDVDGEARTGVFVRHHMPICRFPLMTAQWLHHIGLMRVAMLVAPMLDLAEQQRLPRPEAVASGMLTLAYHMVAVRWLAASASGVERQHIEHARTLIADGRWIEELAGVSFNPDLIELAQEQWADGQFWSEMDAVRTDAWIRPDTQSGHNTRAEAPDVNVDELLGSYTFSANELGEDVPDVDAAINALLAPRTGEQLPLHSPVLEGWLGFLGMMVDHKAVFAPGHAARVVNMTREVALLLEADDVEVLRLTLGAWVYGVGKLALPSALLEQSGGLNDVQRAMVRETPRLTVSTMAPLRALLPSIDEVAAYAERMDGSGYPKGLRSDDIPLPGRLLAVVDTYEALIADRPYRLAYSNARALHIVQAQSGRLFDGVITDLLEGITRGEL